MRERMSAPKSVPGTGTDRKRREEMRREKSPPVLSPSEPMLTRGRLERSDRRLCPACLKVRRSVSSMSEIPASCIAFLRVSYSSGVSAGVSFAPSMATKPASLLPSRPLTTAAAAFFTPGQRRMALSISPSSTRKPFTLT